MLPAVLGTLLVVGVISFAMGLVASLESLAARSAAGAVEARALAEGAVALALAEVREQATAEAPLEAGSGSSIVYGPWAAAGIDATATLTTLAASGDGEDGAPGGVLLLRAEVATERAGASASLVFTLEPELTVLERRRP